MEGKYFYCHTEAGYPAQPEKGRRNPEYIPLQFKSRF